MLELQLIGALDADLIGGAAAKLAQGVIEQAIARVGRLIVQPEVRTLKRRQDAGEDDLSVAVIGGRAGEVDEAGELALHAAQAVAAKHHRIDAALQVEQAKLVTPQRLVHRRQDLARQRRRATGRVDDEQLLFGADAADALLKGALVEHLLHGADIAQQVAHELTTRLICSLSAVALITHRTPRSLLKMNCNAMR